jgi:GNAT superfamily N-acetyltransferase
MSNEPTRNPSERGRGIRRTIWSSRLYQQTYGIAAAATRPLRRFELAIVYRKSLATQLAAFSPAADLVIGPASAEDVEQAARLSRDSSHRIEVFRWRLQNNCICFVARAGSSPVGYVWMRYRSGRDDGDLIDLSDGEVYHFDSYVADGWRGHRIHPALSSRLLLFDQSQGYSAAYTKVSAMNRRSQKTVRRVGWKLSGLVLRVRGSRRGGWPILTLWGSAHPLMQLRQEIKRAVQKEPPR